MTEIICSFFVRPFNCDIFCTTKKFLVFNLVSRDLKIKYRRSFFGFFWTILHPLGLCGIYYIVFKQILNVNIPHYVPFILSGVMPWTFFSVTVIEGTETLAGNSSLVTKVPIPTQVFPLVACITNFITFLLAIPVVIGFALYSGVSFGASLIWLPFLSFILFMMANSLALIFSVLYVYLRDLKHAISLIMQIWFYVTPIIYRAEMIPERFKAILFWNPVGLLFTSFHEAILGQPIPILHIAVSLAWAGIFFSIALYVQIKYSGNAAELL
jgi:ABC-2 type transport system permease protein